MASVCQQYGIAFLRHIGRYPLLTLGVGFHGLRTGAAIEGIYRNRWNVTAKSVTLHAPEKSPTVVIGCRPLIADIFKGPMHHATSPGKRSAVYS